MGRILFFLLLALVIYLGWRAMRAPRSGPDREGGRRGARDPRASEPMVRCEVCGINLPRSEALPAPGSNTGRWYCSEAHRREGSDAR